MKRHSDTSVRYLTLRLLCSDQFCLLPFGHAIIWLPLYFQNICLCLWIVEWLRYKSCGVLSLDWCYMVRCNVKMGGCPLQKLECVLMEFKTCVHNQSYKRCFFCYSTEAATMMTWWHTLDKIKECIATYNAIIHAWSVLFYFSSFNYLALLFDCLKTEVIVYLAVVQYSCWVGFWSAVFLEKEKAESVKCCLHVAYELMKSNIQPKVSMKHVFLVIKGRKVSERRNSWYIYRVVHNKTFKVVNKNLLLWWLSICCVVTNAKLCISPN